MRTDLDNIFRLIEAGDLELIDAPEPAPDYDPGTGRIPYCGAQVGWSPLREGMVAAHPDRPDERAATSVALIAPDGLLAVVEGVCSECKGGFVDDPIFGRRVCLGCLREGG